jgi:hypothetical protein
VGDFNLKIERGRSEVVSSGAIADNFGCHSDSVILPAFATAELSELHNDFDPISV